MSLPQVVVWDDIPTMSTMVRLEVDNKFVQRPITRESIEDHFNPRELFRETLAILCAEWFKQFGQRIKAIAPEAEGVAWRIDADNTIDGEIVTREIEGGETDAKGGCIEGR